MQRGIEFHLDASGTQVEDQIQAIHAAGDHVWVQMMERDIAVTIFYIGDHTVIGGQRYEIETVNPNGALCLRRV